MDQALQNQIALVTGAASGIGLACARTMIAQGARVVLVDRDREAVHACAAELGAAAMPLVADLLDAEQCAALVPRALAMAGQLDILHANAGSYIGGDLVDTTSTAIDRMLNLNINVVMKNVHDVLPYMIARGRGDIVVTSSLAAHFPTPWEPVYASSKWAIHCFVQTVRRQVFKHGSGSVPSRRGRWRARWWPTGLRPGWPRRGLREACCRRRRSPTCSCTCCPARAASPSAMWC